MSVRSPTSPGMSRIAVKRIRTGTLDAPHAGTWDIRKLCVGLETPKKGGISDFVRRYNVLMEFSNASYGLKFRQLLPREAEKARRQIQELFVKNARKSEGCCRP